MNRQERALVEILAVEPAGLPIGPRPLTRKVAKLLAGRGLVKIREDGSRAALTAAGFAELGRVDPQDRFVENGVGLIVRVPGEPICPICDCSVGAHEIPTFAARCKKFTDEILSEKEGQL